jgi:hypothetical protein
MLTSGVVLLREIALPHTAARTRALLEHFNWELFDHGVEESIIWMEETGVTGER